MPNTEVNNASPVERRHSRLNRFLIIAGLVAGVFTGCDTGRPPVDTAAATKTDSTSVVTPTQEPTPQEFPPTIVIEDQEKPTEPTINDFFHLDLKFKYAAEKGTNWDEVRDKYDALYSATKIPDYLAEVAKKIDFKQSDLRFNVYWETSDTTSSMQSNQDQTDEPTEEPKYSLLTASEEDEDQMYISLRLQLSGNSIELISIKKDRSGALRYLAVDPSTVNLEHPTYVDLNAAPGSNILDVAALAKWYQFLESGFGLFQNQPLMKGVVSEALDQAITKRQTAAQRQGLDVTVSITPDLKMVVVSNVEN